ncbi:unnamed protein product [Rhizoctonia solani]|uniref:Gti1/Pac2 family-domain-containing protein n=1 Tax=Rhizoctonia solani TaxID=456999 RepID=A0A8H2WF51_9AGAM|nr:unnamed protein product [Rhizoctonia solani]
MSQSDTSQTPKLILKSTKDALLVIEAAERGLFRRLVRRLTEPERAQSIYSGSVLVYDESESHIRRFTDTLVWSPSRIIGNYLVYREMREREPRPTSRAGAALPPQPASSRSLVRPRVQSSLEQSEAERKRKEQLYVGSLTHHEKFKPNGLVKRTFSLMTEGKHIHVIGYYTYEDAMEDRFLSPSEHPEFAKLTLSQDLLKDKSAFRVPPQIEELEDGHLVYAGEEEKKGTSDSERASADRTSPASSASGPPSRLSFPLHPFTEVQSQTNPISELPPLRALPLTPSWDHMPATDPSMFDKPAYTCQSRSDPTQYFSGFNSPAHTQDQLSLPPLSLPSLDPSPPPIRPVSRLRNARKFPYPDNQGRPRATNLHIARSLRDSEFNPINSSFSTFTPTEFPPESLTWSIPPSNLRGGERTMLPEYMHPPAIGSASMRSGTLEQLPLQIEHRPFEHEVGPSGETVEYDPVPTGRYGRGENTSIE